MSASEFTALFGHIPGLLPAVALEQAARASVSAIDAIVDELMDRMVERANDAYFGNPDGFVMREALVAAIGEATPAQVQAAEAAWRNRYDVCSELGDNREDAMRAAIGAALALVVTS